MTAGPKAEQDPELGEKMFVTFYECSSTSR